MVAPLIGDVSIIINVVLLVAFAVVYFAIPPSAKLLIKKKLGFLQNKTLNLIAWDDRVLQLEAEDAQPEGMLESKSKKHSISKSFYLAKPQDDTANPSQNIINSERDLAVLPFYHLDGIPVGFSHISKAIVTNPKVLTALRVANSVDPEKPKEFKAEVALPTEIEIEKNGKPLKTRFLEVLVRLPFDPIDIKRNFPLYWQQSNIDSTKRRNREIGKEMTKTESTGLGKTILIICAVVGCVIVIAGVVLVKLLG